MSSLFEISLKSHLRIGLHRWTRSRKCLSEPMSANMSVRIFSTSPENRLASFQVIIVRWFCDDLTKIEHLLSFLSLKITAMFTQTARTYCKSEWYKNKGYKQHRVFARANDVFESNWKNYINLWFSSSRFTWNKWKVGEEWSLCSVFFRTLKKYNFVIWSCDLSCIFYTWLINSVE